MSRRSIVSQLRLIDRLLRLPKTLSKPLLVSNLREDQRCLIEALDDGSGLIPMNSTTGKLFKLLPRASAEEVDAILNEILRAA